MNVIKKLENMNMYQLHKICQKINVPCPKTKRNVIQNLLKPLKIKYRMESKLLPVDVAQVNTKMLKNLAEYRKQKLNEKATKIQKRMRGYLSRKKCHKQIKNFLKIRNSIDRDKELHNKNPTSLRKKTLQIRKNQMKDCLQDKKSSNVRP